MYRKGVPNFTSLLDVLLVLIFILQLSLNAIGEESAAFYEAEVQTLTAELEAVPDTTDLEEALETERLNAQSLKYVLAHKESAIDSLVRKANGLETELEQAQSALEELEAEALNARETLTAQEEQLEEAEDLRAEVSKFQEMIETYEQIISDLRKEVDAQEEKAKALEEQQGRKQVVPLKTLDICNYTRTLQQMAFAYYDVTEKAWVSEGWTIMEVNECTTMDFNNGQNHIYYYSERYGNIPLEDRSVGSKFCVRMRDFRFPDGTYIKNATQPRECLRYAGYHIVRMNLVVSRDNDGNDDNSAVLHMSVIE